MFRISFSQLLLLFTAFATTQAQAQVTTQAQDTLAIEEVNNVIPTQIAEKIKRYKLGEITVSGNVKYNEMTIFAVTGLTKGQEISIPGEQLSSAIHKLWNMGTFSEIDFYEKSIDGDVLNLELHLVELPKINNVTLEGLGKNKTKELLAEMKLDETRRQGKPITKNLLTNIENHIKHKYQEEGFYQTTVDIELTETADEDKRDMTITFDKGKKVRISEINFTGNEQLSDGKLRRNMKKTKQKSFLNPIRIFSPSKFIEDRYEEDLVNIIEKYKEMGYRDARVVRDSFAYQPDSNTMKIDIELEEGKKYYIGDVRFIGNTAYTEQELRRTFIIKKGDVYNGVLLKQRIDDPMGYSLSSVYQDNGYLWSRIIPIERIENDTINLDFRVVEGPQARYNKITVSGNDKTHDYVVLREVTTRPGQLWRRSELIESIRRLGAMGIFDAESVSQPDIHNMDYDNGTVDVNWNVLESGQSQIEVQGGYGGNTFIGTLAVSLNNFSLKNIFNKDAYKPLPMGDAQKMSLRLQASSYFQVYSLSFQEPWFGGRKPTQLFGSVSYSRQNFYDYRSRRVDRSQGLGIMSVSLGLAKRLSVPDDKFVLSHTLSYQHYDLDNYGIGSISFNNGTARNLAYGIELTRDNVGGIDPFIYPSTGARISLGAKFSPPYSLFNGIDYADLANQEEYKRKTTEVQSNPATGADIPVGSYLDENGLPVSNYQDAAVDQAKLDKKRFNWLEYYKVNFRADWYNTVIGKMVLKTTVQFGFLGAYNQDRGVIPFERYYLGGSGMVNYSLDGRDIVAMRGYDESALTPDGRLGGTVYNKFSLELRYPVSLESQMKAYVLAFADAGAAYTDFKNYNPFKVQRSVGAGVRVSMPMLGLLGIDFGYGFDKTPGTNQIGGWQTHFILGREL